MTRQISRSRAYLLQNFFMQRDNACFVGHFLWCAYNKTIQMEFQLMSFLSAKIICSIR